MKPDNPFKQQNHTLLGILFENTTIWIRKMTKQFWGDPGIVGYKLLLNTKNNRKIAFEIITNLHSKSY